MKLLSHFNTSDKKLLNIINDDWPFQFLPGFSSFNLAFYTQHVFIVFDEELQAFMPIRFQDYKIFSHGQILFAPMRNAKELSPEEQLLFFENLKKTLYYGGNCERLMQPHPYSILAAHPAGSEYCEFGTYVVDLENQTPEVILEKFHPKYQKAVSHSVKNNAVVKIGMDVLPDFFRAYETTMKRINKYYDSYSYFENLLKYLGDERICCAVVYDQGEVVSGIFLIYTKYGAFLTHAGTQGESKLYGAAKLLNFETMKYLQNKGVKRYDFVGVRLKNENNPELEGVFRFKKGFGGDLKQGYLWKHDILPMKAKLFDILLYVKTKGKKSFDIIDQVNQ